MESADPRFSPGRSFMAWRTAKTTPIATARSRWTSCTTTCTSGSVPPRQTRPRRSSCTAFGATCTWPAAPSPNAACCLPSWYKRSRAGHVAAGRRRVGTRSSRHSQQTRWPRRPERHTAVIDDDSRSVSDAAIRALSHERGTHWTRGQIAILEAGLVYPGFGPP